MKSTNLAYDKSNLRARVNDELFLFSIRSIANDIVLNEIKTDKELTTIAVISSFEEDEANDITDHLSYEFADQGNDTLLLSIKKGRRIEEYKNKINEKFEENILKTHIKNLDFLLIDRLVNQKHYCMDRASFESLLVSLKTKYKRIIIDTPPLEEDMAGFISAVAADGIYLICNSKSSRWSEVQNYYDNLKSIGANILGIIYNNAEQKVVKRMYKKSAKNYG